MSEWLKKQRVGVVGGGVVGQATARAYLEHVAEVRVFDLAFERRTASLGPTLDSDVVFVCLPTPQKKESLGYDLSTMERFFESAATTRPNTNYVLRSTVPIGTTRRLAEKYRLLNLVHSPEFLTARCATVDAQLPSRNLIGGAYSAWTGPTDEDTKEVRIGLGEAYLLKFYAERFPHVQTILLSSDETEAVKLFANAFFAVKVALFNEFRCLADKLDLNWDHVINAMRLDGRIHPSHTQVPGPDGKFGFGGTCLPKDLASLLAQMIDNGLLNHENSRLVVEAAHFRNLHDRRRGL